MVKGESSEWAKNKAKNFAINLSRNDSQNLSISWSVKESVKGIGTCCKLSLINTILRQDIAFSIGKTNIGILLDLNLKESQSISQYLLF